VSFKHVKNTCFLNNMDKVGINFIKIICASQFFFFLFLKRKLSHFYKLGLKKFLLPNFEEISIHKISVRNYFVFKSNVLYSDIKLNLI
jgi:hypothetical protein